VRGLALAIALAVVGGGCDLVFPVGGGGPGPGVDGRGVDGRIDGGGTFMFGGRTEAGTAAGSGATADTHLSLFHSTMNYGGDAEIFVCRFCNGSVPSGDTVHGLLRFDLTAIPAGAMVSVATLLLDTTWPDGSVASGDVGVFEVFEPWTEGSGGSGGAFGQANWTMRDSLASWTDAGAGPSGSRASLPIDTFSPTESPPFTYELDVTQLVQRWVDSPLSNHGIALELLSGDSDTEFRSSESPIEEGRPGLRVTYGP
jgi:hypothetical protein